MNEPLKLTTPRELMNSFREAVTKDGWQVLKGQFVSHTELGVPLLIEDILEYKDGYGHTAVILKVRGNGHKAYWYNEELKKYEYKDGYVGCYYAKFFTGDLLNMYQARIDKIKRGFKEDQD